MKSLVALGCLLLTTALYAQCPLKIQLDFSGADNSDARSNPAKFNKEVKRILSTKGYAVSASSENIIDVDLHWSPYEGAFSTYGDKWLATVHLKKNGKVLSQGQGKAVFWDTVSDSETSHNIYASMHGDGFYPVDAAILRGLEKLQACT